MDPNEAPKGLGPSSEDISETVAANGESSAVAERPASPPQGEVEVDLAGRAGAVTDEEEQQQRPALPYPVVGFGASAGGLQAVREVMENLPEKPVWPTCW